MPQLVFHGKKTVPAALRRDSWRPYFSVHFPETPAGAKVGMKAYRRLREFALSRQLQPPKGYLVATEEDQRRAKAKVGDPTDLREQLEKRDLKLPIVGQKLSKKLRGEKLMNQGATSVADLAFTLQLAKKALPKVEERVKTHTTKGKDLVRKEELGPRRWMKLRQMRKAEEAQRQVIAERQALVDTINVRQGQMPLDRKVAKQLSIEYDGAVAGSNRVINKADIERSKSAAADGSYDIQVLWADIRDGTYAQAWPEGVFHGELQPVVISQKTRMQVRQPETTDEDGVKIEQQRAPVSAVTGSSPHIIGREKGQGYRPFQDVLRDDAERRRAVQESKEKSTVDVSVRRSFATMKEKQGESIEEFERLVADPEYLDLAHKESNEEYLNLSERTMLADFQTKHAQLLAALRELRQLEIKHPAVASEADIHDCWNGRFINRSRTVEELEALQNQLEVGRGDTAARIQVLEARVESLVQRYSPTGEESTPLFDQRSSMSLRNAREELTRWRTEIEDVEGVLQRLNEEADNLDTMFFEHEKETERIEKELSEDKRSRIENKLLQSVLTERGRKISDLKEQIAEQKKTAIAAAESATQIARQDVGTPDAPIDAAGPSSSPGSETDVLKQELKELQTAQESDQTKLKQLKDSAYQRFFEEYQSLDVEALLPRAYRDEQYWPGTEFEVQKRQEVPRIEEIDPQMEEKKGLVSRIRERLGW